MLMSKLLLLFLENKIHYIYTCQTRLRHMHIATAEHSAQKKIKIVCFNIKYIYLFLEIHVINHVN